MKREGKTLESCVKQGKKEESGKALQNLQKRAIECIIQK